MKINQKVRQAIENAINNAILESPAYYQDMQEVCTLPLTSNALRLALTGIEAKEIKYTLHHTKGVFADSVGYSKTFKITDIHNGNIYIILDFMGVYANVQIGRIHHG